MFHVKQNREGRHDAGPPCSYLFVKLILDSNRGAARDRGGVAAAIDVTGNMGRAQHHKQGHAPQKHLSGFSFSLNR